MKYLFYTNFANSDNDRLLALTDSLPPKEKDRIYSFIHKSDQVLALGGRLLLIYAMNRFNKTRVGAFPQLEFNSYGKPFINGSNISFNISHSGTIVACACLTNSRIGVDIEHQTSSIELSEFESVFTPTEYENLKTNNCADFFRMWTVKEAVMKAIGKGFSMNPQLIDTTSLQATGKLMVEGSEWFIYSHHLDNYTLSVASSEPKIPLVKEVDWGDLLTLF